MTNEPTYPPDRLPRKSSRPPRLIAARRERITLPYQRIPPTFQPEHPSGYQFPTCYEQILFARSMITLWPNYTQYLFPGEPWAWIPLLILFAAYPARFFCNTIEVSSGLIFISWALVFLYCLISIGMTFSTASSENSEWFRQNTSDYYEFVLSTTAIRQVIFTLPFLFHRRLRLPKVETKSLLIFIGVGGTDIALLSTLPQLLLIHRI